MLESGERKEILTTVYKDSFDSWTSCAKINFDEIPVPCLQSCTSFSKYLFYLVQSVESFYQIYSLTR